MCYVIQAMVAWHIQKQQYVPAYRMRCEAKHKVYWTTKPEDTFPVFIDGQLIWTVDEQKNIADSTAR